MKRKRRSKGQLVSAEFLSTLGVKPLVGRDFLPEEDREGATTAVILSYGLWQRRFGNDPSIIGRQLTLNNQSYTVVGVMPPDFQYGLEADVTVPFGLQAQRFSRRGADPGTDVVARLKPNISQQQGEMDLNLVAARLEQQYPKSNKGRRVLLTPLHENFVGDAQQPLLILLGAVARLADNSQTRGPVLDAGCGSLLFTAEAHLGCGRTVIACDQSVDMLRRARKRLMKLNRLDDGAQCRTGEEPSMSDWKPEIRRRLAGLKLEPTREAAIVEELAQCLEDRYAEML